MKDYESLISNLEPAYRAWLDANPEDVLHGEFILLYSRVSLLERNETGEMDVYLPDYLMIGDDSGPRVFVIQRSPASPVFAVDIGSLDQEAFEKIAPSFSAWQESAFSLPEPPPDGLPLNADIFINYVNDLKVMFALRKFLAQDWVAGEMKTMMNSQPFLAMVSGAPIALRRMLESQPELKLYLFYDCNGKLEKINGDQ